MLIGSKTKADAFVNAASGTLQRPLVVYIIIPNTFANLSHPAAANIFQVISDISSSFGPSSGRVHFHLVPEVFISHSQSLAHNQLFSLERLVLAVYDAIPRFSDRQHSRLSAHRKPARERMSAHAFALAYESTPKVFYVEQWPAPPSNILDRYTILHIGYGVSKDGNWVVASAISQHGDEQENQIWEGEGVVYSDPAQAIVRRVFDFAMRFSRRADVEWRVVISRLGPMPEAELAGMLTESFHLHC